ncbi:hypothetical protein SPF06_01125 [Sinomonas sp. JGH33]|uniref:Uncharacterized protein n=1 Tax=Sinomonas terricola TaxID=3110330 RepID=A0ABU5T0W4_9MICC|nr:hypothetical protein [Sinomonas sp. JGH33]MEA5453313.1 hypothetical protein [Sinomonas sp. JGH33]
MTRWQVYWSIWACGSFLTFLGPEIYALCTNVENTLSFTVWDLEGGQPGDPITKWTSTHVLFGGVLTVVLLWLIGHLVFGVWRNWK